MLTKVRALIEELNNSEIRYCHWKSNLSLEDSLSGKTDIDLLVDMDDAGQFRLLLARLAFQPTVVASVESFPSVEHYFALDKESGILAHVHAYYQVITGDSLTKNYHFPIEDMLLQNTRKELSVRVPRKSAELIVFTLRMMLKHTSLTELVMLSRYWKQVGVELNWLLADNSLDETLALITYWLPAVDPDLFSACIASLKAPAPILRRILLGQQLRSQLRPYARYSSLRSRLKGLRKFTVMLSRRLAGSKLGMKPRSGGAVIAFVGSEATGKTTLLAEMERWLGEHFDTDRIHVGKPKSTLLSAVPNLLVPALRRLLPSYRSTRVAEQHLTRTEAEESHQRYPLLFALRSALLAYDRRTLLARAFNQAANGTVILCDRYPSSQSGVPDGPQLAPLAVERNGNSIRHLLARLEAKLYREIPPPDLVVYLCAPLEVTLARNHNRDKTEPEEYVRWRHARTANLTFDGTQVCRIDTDQPFDLTVLEVKTAIWNSLPR